MYLSTDAPALHQLVAGTFPNSFRMVPGDGLAASWEAEQPAASYVKVVADFEALRTCDTILSFASSAYANMASSNSLLVASHVPATRFCSLQQPRARSAAKLPPRELVLRRFTLCLGAAAGGVYSSGVT